MIRNQCCCALAACYCRLTNDSDTAAIFQTEILTLDRTNPGQRFLPFFATDEL
jgi:hypothetical protein